MEIEKIHEGPRFDAYYCTVKKFKEDLAAFSEWMESLEGTVTSIIPDTGNPSVSITLGSPGKLRTKVNGLGVIVTKS